MNGFLNSGLGIWELLGLLAALVGAVVAIKFTISFDLNRHLESRRDRYSQKLINACPHVRIVRNGGGRMGLQSEFISPSGTLTYICQRCGLQKYLLEGEAEERMVFYANHPEVLQQHNKEFYRLLKKSGQV